MNWLSRNRLKNAPPALRLSDIDGGPARGSFVLHPEDITGNQPRELIYTGGGSETRVIFMRLADNQIYAFENRCPHASTPLNASGASCTDSGGYYLMCHTHGALFEPQSGYCTRGPCKGQYLRRVDVDIRSDGIYSR